MENKSSDSSSPIAPPRCASRAIGRRDSLNLAMQRIDSKRDLLCRSNDNQSSRTLMSTSSTGSNGATLAPRRRAGRRCDFQKNKMLSMSNIMDGVDEDDDTTATRHNYRRVKLMKSLSSISIGIDDDDDNNGLDDDIVSLGNKINDSFRIETSAP